MIGLIGVVGLALVTSASRTWLILILAFALVAVGWLCARHPAATAVTLAALLVAMGSESLGSEHTRSFYGAYEIRSENGEHTLVHGTTVHGLQFRDTQRSGLPTTYYTGPGSCADVLDLMRERLREVGVVGLGTGTIAAHGRAGEHYTFFEIDPGIVDLALDPDLFSFVDDSAAEIRTVVGDGRLKVAEEPAGMFDVLILDAFSSDSISVHLLTQEAFDVYRSRLANGGVLLVHISNRYFDLRPSLLRTRRDWTWQRRLATARGTGPAATRAPG